MSNTPSLARRNPASRPTMGALRRAAEAAGYACGGVLGETDGTSVVGRFSRMRGAGVASGALVVALGCAAIFGG